MKKLKVLFLAIISLCTFAFSACGEKCTHQVETWSVRTPATCLEAGEEYGVCTLCGKEQTRDIAALGHDMVLVAAKTPDCDDVGWAEYEECQREGCNYSTKVEIPANGHAFTDGVHCDNCIELNATAGLLFNEFNQYVIAEGVEDAFDGDTVIIPAYYNGKPVTEIEEYAFYENATIKTVVLPDSITYIGERAFAMCANLQTVVIGNGDMTIDARAFNQCANLTYLELGTGEKTFETNAFYGAYRLVNIYNKSSTVLTQLSSANGEVAKYARKISTTGTDLLPITKDDDGFIYYTENSEKHLIAYTGTKTEITLPEGIVYVESYCFERQTSLTSVTFPSTVKEIKESAFIYCNALTALNLNEGLERIGMNVINYTTNLKSLTIPSTVVYIARGAMNWNSLETLVFLDKTGWKYQRNSTQGTINASDLENPAQTVLKFKSGGAWEYYVLYKGTLA